MITVKSTPLQDIVQEAQRIIEKPRKGALFFDSSAAWQFAFVVQALLTEDYNASTPILT